jgi:hypothetical protein
MCGFILALGRQMYKSKCREIQCCCLKIVRDVESEEKYDEMELHNPRRNDVESAEPIVVEGQVNN